MHARSLLSVLVAGSLLLAGCSTISDALDGEPVTPLPTESATPPSGEAALSRYYEQTLDWQDCGPGQCALLTVPLDYANPGGDVVRLAVLKVPAKKQGRRLGSLVVNPGGPGGSGVQYAAAADLIVDGPVRDQFDIVGFDPRGVGQSQPIDCVDDAQLDQFLGYDPTPDSPQEEHAFAEHSKQFAAACGRNAGPLLGHASTDDVAKDMDILRAVLGESKLNYLGKSYGTFLGATYADLFPERVGRFVLDGALAPDLTSVEINTGQAEGFELATRQWAASCVDEGDCPLGGSVDEVMQGMRELLKDLDSSPVPIDDPRVSALTEGWASLGIAQAMYDQSQWGVLTSALRDLVEQQNGQKLMQLADQYADRQPSGQYTNNIMEVIYAVNCLDSPDSKNLADYERYQAQAEKVAPTWGSFLAWSSMPCGFWPVGPTGEPHKISAEGSDPIVVVGTTRDPATPYKWAVRLNDQLANSSLITFDGDGHTAYTRSNACVDDAVNDYYTDGTVPQDGLKC
jgi:pimeloyl-ACP methyl ester carboxylesterase